MACTLDIQTGGDALTADGHYRLPTAAVSDPQRALEREGDRILTDLLDFEAALAADAPDLWVSAPLVAAASELGGGAPRVSS